MQLLFEPGNDILRSKGLAAHSRMIMALFTY